MKNIFTIKILLVFIVVSLFISCNKRNSFEIIQPLINDLSSFKAEVILRTSLSKDPKAYIGRITSITYYKERFYILDTYKINGFTIFSKDGELQFRTKRGKGPGELIFPFSLDIVDNQLLVSDCNMIKKYSLDGQYLTMSTLTAGQIARNLLFLDNGNILTYGTSRPLKYKTKIDSINQEYYRYHVYDRDMQNELDQFVKVSLDYAPLECDKPFTLYNDHVLLLSQPENAIYEYNGSRLITRYLVDFGKFSYIKDDFNLSKENLTFLIQQKQRLGILDNIYETDDFISFSYVGWNNGSNEVIIYSKSSKRTAKLADVLKQSNLPNMAIAGTIGESFICSFNPSALDSIEMQELIDRRVIDRNAVDDDNQIIYIISIVEK